MIVQNPYTGETVCEIALDAGVALDARLERTTQAQQVWSALEVCERARRVAAALEYFREHAEEVARDITLQMGKPLAQARGELGGMFDRAQYTLSIAERVLAPEVLPDKEGLRFRIEHDPLGVVFNLAAWNYPLLIPINVIVPALLAGNSVLLKHSRTTPLCGVHFERAFAAVEPAGLVTSIQTTHEETARLIGDPRVAHVAFTGSVEGGRAVQRAASERFIDVGLELGGKDPAYVAADADLAFAVGNIVDGACYNAGQSCCAVERVYVHESLYEDFLERATALMEAYRMGDPLDEETTLGPMVRSSAVDFLEGQVGAALAAGARALCGGKRSDDRFFPPTLLADCPQDSAVMQEESFGPLLPVRAVTGDEEALALMNDSPFGLTASVWTCDDALAERFVRGLRTGTVFQNRCDFLDPCLPWTGVGDSGKGSTLSPYGFHHLTRRKAVHLRSAP
ncbi:MAG: aldehyde dehydrogenase family protein [Planctomycetota bacterium]|nr:aldehyde dehydrogenase family protein [Planctomycetota bacterium]